MPFPRCKANPYDMGVRVPLVIRWGAQVKPNRRTTDFVSLIDLGPTFLDPAGEEIPAQKHGRSLVPILRSEKVGRVEPLVHSLDAINTQWDAEVEKKFVEEVPEPGALDLDIDLK